MHGETETILSGTVDCGKCGCEMVEGDEIAEIFDPSNPDETDIVHADCIPNGWEIA